MKSHQLKWFRERIGQTIKRGNVEVEVTEENYTGLYEVQDEENNYVFTDK